MILTPWRPLTDGIDYARGISNVAFDMPGVARQLSLFACRIQLTNPDVGFCSTLPGGPYQTRNETALDFLANNPDVVVAINGAFAWADASGNASLFGLVVSQGILVCDPTVPAPQPTPTDRPDVPDQTCCGTAALTITKDGRCAFQVANAMQHPDLSEIQYSLPGSPQPVVSNYQWPPRPFVGGLQAGECMLLRDGINRGIPSANGTDGELIAARTAVGLSKDRQYLYLVTVDGIEGASPPYGATFYDVGCCMQALGAWDAISVDGGGSTCIAYRTPEGRLIPLNIPHGTESEPFVFRRNAHFFGVTLNSRP